MAPTEDEKERQRLRASQRALAEKVYARRQQLLGQENPMYGTDPFEPSAKLPRVPSDPALSQPLPSGRFIEPGFPTAAAVARAADITEYRLNPPKYIMDNIGPLNNEQSLIERGATMLQRVFNYKDPADLQVFGISLAPVESTWDGFLRYFTGFFDLLSVGYGGLISAAPGGIRTLSYDELSGGLTPGQVLSGEMEPGMAPSPGQIALTSIAVEAKRIRDGNARLSDVLLANPATGPFILAALAADTSPLQQNGFNIMDKEQREKAFSTGWEKWMSGVTDAGLMFADPTIGAGVALKVARAGALGVPGTVKFGQNFKGLIEDAVEQVSPGNMAQMDDLVEIGRQRLAAQETGGVTRRIMDDPDYEPETFIQKVEFLDTDPVPEYSNPLSAWLRRLHTVRADGTRVVTKKELEQDPNLLAHTDISSVVDILYRTQSPAHTALVLEAMSGTAGAFDKLMLVDAGLADVVFRFDRNRKAAMAATQPQKNADVLGGLSKQMENTRQNLRAVNEQLRGIIPDADGNLSSAQIKMQQDLTRTAAVHQSNLDELMELYDVSAGRKELDFLDPTNPFYDEKTANSIMASLLDARDVQARFINASLRETATNMRMFLPANNNAYTRMVMKSRDRRRTARFQYAEEGTSIFPHKRVVRTVDGKVIREADGWFSPSQFPGTSALRRNMRVWRWIGSETPNGYIGLKGTATVGAEREFTAATNTELYRGAPVQVTRDKKNAAGELVFEKVRDEQTGREVLRVKRETIEVGGIQARERYFSEFYEALNNPNVDAKQVLDDIERRMMDDYAAAYGLDQEGMQDMLRVAARHREANLDLLRKEGYFVDPRDGEVQHIPYSDAQLANGTYMQNWFELEDIIKREYAKDNGERLKQSFRYPAEIAGSAYNTFNNFWRPATLMRLSYTQRNIFEGTLRAIAYSASLAPLLWPVKATYFGTRNGIVRRQTTARLKQAERKIADSEYGGFMETYKQAMIDEYYMRSAIRQPKTATTEPVWIVFDRDKNIREMTQADYDVALEEAMQRVTDAKGVLKSKEAEFTKSVEGTAFGKWRAKNMRALEEAIEANQAQLDIFSSTAQDLADDGFPRLFDQSQIAVIADLVNANRKAQIDLEALRIDPTQAFAMYRTQAGRMKRIGSGTSIGPDGNYYGDAYTGPYEGINSSLMSADTTIAQGLSLGSGVFSSLFLKTMARANEAIPFTPATQKQWVDGMSQVIEEASSSWLVRSLVRNNWDEEKVLAEMRTALPEGVTPSSDEQMGNIYLTRMLGLQGRGDLRDVAATADDGSKKARSAYVGDSVAKRTAIVPFIKAERTPSGTRQVSASDLNQARTFINEVANQTKAQMQNRAEFMLLLERRARDKGVREATGTTTAQVTSREVEDALRQIPADQQQRLGYVQGVDIVQYGADGVMNTWARIANFIFKYLGTIPEDYVTRGGFYNMRFKAARNTLMENYLVASGQATAIKRGQAKKATNADEGMTSAHGEFNIPQNELNRIIQQAHRAALRDTREWMYTIERRTNLGKYGEWIYPFISAQQNSLTVVGKLLYKEPWLAPMVSTLWQMPTRLGIEDEQGNVLIPIPFEWVRETLKDNPDVPFLGGVVDSADNLRIPKDGINVFMPETGYGVVPRPTPWVQVGFSEIMKKNLFPVETPALVKAVFGEQGGDEWYQGFKDYIFGEEQGLSSKPLSWDKLVPAYAQKVIQSKDTLSAQYGYQYATHMNTQMMRYRNNERETMPDEKEIHKRTTNSLLFAAMGNYGVPTPLAPYPVLTRPLVDTPVAKIQEVYIKLQEADPLNANMQIQTLLGDWALDAALTKVTQNVGGANPTPQTVSDIETLSPLIRSISASLGPNDLNVLGILVNNRRPAESFEQSAYNWQKAAKIPGTNREWREVQSPEEAVAERQKISGWTQYRMFVAQLEAQMFSAGVTSYESIAGRPYKAAKETAIFNMMNNPDYEGWIVDYQDRGGSKTQSAVRVIEAAVREESFRNLLVKAQKEQLLSIMDQYTSARRLLIQALDETGHSIDHESNRMFKVTWDAMRMRWRAQDERWEEIDALYLSGDDNPQSPGNLFSRDIPEEFQGVAQ